MRKSSLLVIFARFLTFSTSDNVNKNWLQDQLVNHDKENNVKQVLSFTSRPTVENQTTFGSEDTRVELGLLLENGWKAKKSVVLKSLPSTPALREQIAKSGLFNIEIMVHRDALSKMEQVMYKVNDKSEPLWVRALGYKEYEQLLLEDVEEELGYKLANRWAGMDRAHTMMAMKGLAKFHALAAVTDDEFNHKLRDEFKESLLERSYEKLKDFYEVVYNNFAKVIEDSWGPEWTSAARKVREVAPHVKERLYDLYKDRSTFLNTLNVGAPTTRNVFFKYDASDLYRSDKPLATRFSYFQISFFNSAVHDVQYLLNTSPELELMTKYRDEVLLAYYTALEHYLRKFNYKGKVPTLEEFKNEVKRTDFEGITLAIQILPVVFEPDNPNASEDYEQSAQNNANSTTSVLDPYGMTTKQYEKYMKVLLKKALDHKVL